MKLFSRRNTPLSFPRLASRIWFWLFPNNHQAFLLTWLGGKCTAWVVNAKSYSVSQSRGSYINHIGFETTLATLACSINRAHSLFDWLSPADKAYPEFWRTTIITEFWTMTEGAFSLLSLRKVLWGLVTALKFAWLYRRSWRLSALLWTGTGHSRHASFPSFHIWSEMECFCRTNAVQMTYKCISRTIHHFFDVCTHTYISVKENIRNWT